MKKLSLSVMLLLALVGTACCGVDDTTPVNPAAGISGSYSLTNISGGLMGINNNFDSGLIKWTINQQNNTFTIVNNYDDNGTVEDFLETGIYTFVQAAGAPADQCTATYKADNMDLGCFNQAADGTITFNQQHADGYLLTLTHIN
jgi:hypothetical protein